MAAFELGRLTVRAAVDWHVALEGWLGQWRASGLDKAAGLSGSEVEHGRGPVGLTSGEAGQLAMVIWESLVRPRPCRL